MPSHCILKGGRGVGGLVPGGGGLAICGGVGGWRKRWCDDDGLVVGARGHIETAQPSLSLLLSTLGVRPYPVPAATGRNRLTNCATETPTTAPNPPHTTCSNPWYRGRCARELSQHKHLNVPSTQPGPACLGAGGGGVYQRLAQVGHGGNTPQWTPTLWPKECAAEEESPDGSGRRIRQGWDRSDRGAMCAQSLRGGWGRLGNGKGSIQMRSVKGGCTLPHRATRARGRIIIKSAPMQRKPRTSRNTYDLDTLVDGKGGTRKLRQNNLEESFLGVSCKERQARALPQNLEARCPGSSLTNLPSPHHRAGLGRPTSAAALLRMRPWLDHPKSHYDRFEKIPPRRTGPGARRNLEAARGAIKIFRMNHWTTVGFYFGSRVLSGKIVEFCMVAEREP